MSSQVKRILVVVAVLGVAAFFGTNLSGRATGGEGCGGEEESTPTGEKTSELSPDDKAPLAKPDAPELACPPDTPKLCLDGGCRAMMESCGALELCPTGGIKCHDGSCRDNSAECPVVAASCPAGMSRGGRGFCVQDTPVVACPFTCAVGGCAERPEACPCPGEFSQACGVHLCLAPGQDPADCPGPIAKVWHRPVANALDRPQGAAITGQTLAPLELPGNKACPAGLIRTGPSTCGPATRVNAACATGQVRAMGGKCVAAPELCKVGMMRDEAGSCVARTAPDMLEVCPSGSVKAEHTGLCIPAQRMAYQICEPDDSACKQRWMPQAKQEVPGVCPVTTTACMGTNGIAACVVAGKSCPIDGKLKDLPFPPCARIMGHCLSDAQASSCSSGVVLKEGCLANANQVCCTEPAGMRSRPGSEGEIPPNAGEP